MVLKEPGALARQTPAGARQAEEARQTELKHFDGVITRAEDHNVTVELAGGVLITFPFEHVSRANLKFEW